MHNWVISCQKSRSLGQILKKNCLEVKDYISCLVLDKFCQYLCSQDI